MEDITLKASILDKIKDKEYKFLLNDKKILEDIYIFGSLEGVPVTISLFTATMRVYDDKERIYYIDNKDERFDKELETAKKLFKTIFEKEVKNKNEIKRNSRLGL